jgi:hypothetical protein
MGVLTRDVPSSKTVCAFSHEGTPVPATVTLYFEFTNHPPRYLCQEHADAIAKAMPKSIGYVR